MSDIVLASTQLAQRLGVEKSMMIDTIKAQCFRGIRPADITNEQLASYISIAQALELNPLLPGMMYAYPDRGAIIPIVGPDGVMKKLSEIKGLSYECIVYPENPTVPPTHATCNIWIEGKERPYTYTAVYSEWVTPNWGKRPRHWNWLRAVKQAARQVIHGLPMDEDEAIGVGMINVTPPEADATTAAEPTARREPPAREKTGAAKAKENAAKTKETKPVETVEEKKVEPANTTANKKADANTTANIVEGEFVEGEFTKDDEASIEDPVVTELTDDKAVEFKNIRVVEIKRGTISNVENSVMADVVGPFTGRVYHFGSGNAKGWQIEELVTLSLIGKQIKSKPGETAPRFAAMVNAIHLQSSTK
jgi:hypothetical protein